MKYRLLIPFVSLFIFCNNARCQTEGDLFLKAAITKWIHTKEYTLQTASLMPEEKYSFKPMADEMNFGEQLVHLYDNIIWLTSTYLTDIPSPAPKKKAAELTKQQVIDRLKLGYAYAENALRNFNTHNLSDSVTFFAGPMNKLQIINLLNDHQTHHRAQVLVYLRLNGIKPPDYVGW